MGGEQMLETNEKDNLQLVTSAGSSWIICRSKSHAGRIYYFNTLTGEAAWNLSDPEIEKARNRTKVLQGQAGVEFESCPEPKDPPMEINTSSTKQNAQIFPARVYNKQIINNQFPKQTFAPFTTNCANCNTHNVSSLGTNVPLPHNCTPNVWAIPVNHQIVISPSTSSQPVNQSLPAVDVGQNLPIQSTSLPLSRRFNLNQQETPNRNYQQRFAPHFKKFNNNTNVNDLRQKISAKRSFPWNKQARDTDYQADRKISGDSNGIQIIKPSVGNCTSSDADEKWLKENASVQGTQLVLNVVHLKKMVTSGERSSWYVVTDTNVLLNNINLLNVVVNSDEQCQLMVPDFIMLELQNKTLACDTEIISRAHYVLQILSQLFATGCAVIGTYHSTESDNLKIYNFCSQLSLQGHDLVLVSNNIQLEGYKNNCKIHILTIPKLKNLLMLNSMHNPARNFRSLNDIKIIIPNAVNEIRNKDQNPSLISEETQTMDIKLQDNNLKYRTDLDSVPKERTDYNKTSAVMTNIKITKDFGVQTDFMPMYIKEPSPQKVDSSTNTDSDLTGYTNESELKRRGIQLKRNLSCQAYIDNNSEKKQFKWRRRKRFESAPLNPTFNENPENCNPAIQENGMEFTKTNCQLNNDEIINNGISDSQNTNSCYNESSETDSSLCIQKTVLDTVVIEETSTSGIISNSVSNVDSESMCYMRPNEQIYKENVEKDNTCVMFEIKSPAMEEYLKMRCDEWISRFVQIMEEVLTQILQQDPPFFNSTLPPPWTIHEATECIKKKFVDDSDVVDAANKLTSLLFNVSDGRGNIRAELSPAKFMEMYSYGVYLTDSLQSILSNCEDLQTAVNSLAKLLRDIVDPNLDTSHVDSFVETSHIPEANVSLPLSAVGNSPVITGNDVKKSEGKAEKVTTPSSHSPSNLKKYNLRSTQKRTNENQDTPDKPVKFIRHIDIESSFFSCLSLQKNNNVSKQLCFPDKNNITAEEDTLNCNKLAADNKSNEPKIVRNFTKCLEFEEKLKKTLSDHRETFANNEEREDKDIDEYIDEYGYDGEDHNYEYDYYDHEEYDAYNEMDGSKDIKDDGLHVNDHSGVINFDGNIVYKKIMAKFMNEIQETFLEVHSFCKKTQAELITVPVVTSARKLDICEKAEKARSHVNMLCKSLNGILFREDRHCENNLQSVLTQAGFHLDDSKCDEYRIMISKYHRQANILLEAVNIVIEAVK